VIAAWVVVAAASALPQVILQELGGLAVADDARAALAGSVIGLALVTTAAWDRLRPLVPFLVMFLSLVGAQWLVFRVIAHAAAYHDWLADPSFTTQMLADQSLRLMVTCLVIAAVLMVRGRTSRFCLSVGDPRAPMRQLRWLGVGRRAGSRRAIAFSAGVQARAAPGGLDELAA
jgi:hypothetical protein